MSATQFQRKLGLSRYETACQILHKLRVGMVRPDQDRIGGKTGEHVEADETLVGGSTRGEGRGVHHKTLVAAVLPTRIRHLSSLRMAARCDTPSSRPHQLPLPAWHWVPQVKQSG